MSTKPRSIDPDAEPNIMPSINEPPGSEVLPPTESEPKGETKASPTVTKNVSHETSDDDDDDDDEPLPSESDLWKMTRSDLDDLAAERGVKTDHAHNKEEVIHALVRAEKKRKRG